MRNIRYFTYHSSWKVQSRLSWVQWREWRGLQWSRKVTERRWNNTFSKFQSLPIIITFEVAVFEMFFTHTDLFGDSEILSTYSWNTRYSQSFIFRKKYWHSPLRFYAQCVVACKERNSAFAEHRTSLHYNCLVNIAQGPTSWSMFFTHAQ